MHSPIFQNGNKFIQRQKKYSVLFESFPYIALKCFMDLDIWNFEYLIKNIENINFGILCLRYCQLLS